MALLGRWDRALVVIGLTLFVVVFSLFYPRTYSILDEQGFLSFARVFANGTFRADVAGVFVTRHAVVGEHVVPAIGVAMPLLLVLPVLAGWKSAFLVNLILHLLATVACADALRRQELPESYSLLYLLFPVSALFSRTVMSDGATATFVMFGVWAFIRSKERPFAAGLFWGLTLLFRSAQAPFIAGLAAASLLRGIGNWRRSEPAPFRAALWLLAGLLPGITAWLAVNSLLYGGPLSSPVTWPLAIAYLPHHLWRYLLVLGLLYPLMLPICLLHRSILRLEVIIAGAFTLLLYSCFRHFYEGFGGVSGLLIGYRFLLPLFALMFIPYVDFLHTRTPDRLAGPLRMAAIAALFVCYCGLSYMHDKRLGGQAEIQARLYGATELATLIVCEQNAREYFFDGIAKRTVRTTTGLDEGSELLLQIERAAPWAYLVELRRLDRRQAENADTLFAVIKSRFRAEQILRIEKYPDLIELTRVTGSQASAP